jgi:spore maturation protein CgeB
MRTFELGAMGCCMLVEDTSEHRAILGEDGETAVYFRSCTEMLEKLRSLLKQPDERLRLRAAVRARIVAGGHSYGDRLAAMLAATAGTRAA